MRNIIYILICLSLFSCKENESPSCSISQPSQNSTFLVGDIITIAVSASDPDGVISEVNLSLDNIWLETLKQSPFTYSLNSEKLEPGIHIISAVAFDDAGSYESAEATFQLAALPEVNTTEADSVTYSSAIINGEFTFNGLEPISSIGFYWGTEQDPVLNGVKLKAEGKTSPYSIKLDGLDDKTAYYYVAYARTILGETVGDMRFFKTDTFNVSSVSDIMGNNYKTALFGDKWWMTENLKTEQLNDGTPIDEVSDNTTWSESQSPSYSWYSNNGSNADDYGALYNYETVSSGNLCPDGWHVASDQDWKDLEMLYGMTSSQANAESWRGNMQGSRLANDSLKWKSGPLTRSYNFGNTRFDGLPGGSRAIDGVFNEESESGLWWTANSSNDSEALMREINYLEKRVYRGKKDKRAGLSVRCVKD